MARPRKTPEEKVRFIIRTPESTETRYKFWCQMNSLRLDQGVEELLNRVNCPSESKIKEFFEKYQRGDI